MEIFTQRKFVNDKPIENQSKYSVSFDNGQ